MIQGTTPIHIFKIPFDTELIENVRIIYAQNGNVVLTKELKDCTIENGAVMVKLSQEETFAFDAKFPIDIQIRVLTNGGDALASRVERLPIREVLDGAVLQ